MPTEAREQSKIETYPEYIMCDLRQRRGLEEDDTSEDQSIMSMNKNRILDEVCNWNGLINYGSSIRGWIREIYGIDLDNISE